MGKGGATGKQVRQHVQSYSFEDNFMFLNLWLPWRLLAPLPWRRVPGSSPAALQCDGLGQSALLAQLLLQLLRKQTHKSAIMWTGFLSTSVIPQEMVVVVGGGV